MSKKLSWEEFLERKISNHLILLDIDGILMADGEDTIPEEIKNHVARLKENNDIRIVSNAFRKNRCRYASKALKIPWIDSPHKKPSKKIMRYVELDEKKPIIVIGDKFLTDGIFARRIGATGILLKRRTSKKDRLFIKFTYLIDDSFVSFLNVLKAS